VPLLQRSSSLNNRQADRRSFGEKSLGAAPAKIKKAASGLGIELAATDSDKENWSPERQLATDSAQENRAGRNARGARSPARVSRGRSKPTQSQAVVDDDDEVARFMGRERESKSVSEEEELDCVQGLLSLSQGNWR
jgi:hypothetical protein